MVFVCDNGFFYKVTSTFKGPLSSEPIGVLDRALASRLSDKPLIVVMRVGDNVTANAIPWEASNEPPRPWLRSPLEA